jgi:hypothetical protein
LTGGGGLEAGRLRGRGLESVLAGGGGLEAALRGERAGGISDWRRGLEAVLRG